MGARAKPLRARGGARRSGRLAAVCFGTLALLGCALDDRPLHRKPQISYRDAGDGSEGGQGGEGNPVRTWTFDDGTQDWSPEAGIEQRFKKDDAEGDEHSGSLFLTHTLVANSDEFELGGTMQCLPVTGDTTYRLSTKTFVPKDQGPGGSGFIMAFFNAPDCQGLQLDLLNYASDKTDVWIPAQKTRRAPAGTKSLMLRLVVTKVWRLTRFEAAFDDVVLSEF